MSHYAQWFYAKGPVRGVPLWAVVDGTLQETCIPNESFAVQRECYSGHHKQHGLEYLAFATPGGLCAWLYGPVEGCIAMIWPCYGIRDCTTSCGESGVIMISNMLTTYWVMMPFITLQT